MLLFNFHKKYFRQLLKKLPIRYMRAVLVLAQKGLAFQTVLTYRLGENVEVGRSMRHLIGHLSSCHQVYARIIFNSLCYYDNACDS